MTDGSNPIGPVVIVRPGISFWIATDPRTLTSTMSAFERNVFGDALFFDRSGCCWTVAEAKLSGQPSLGDRLVPWRRVAVSVIYDQSRPSGLDELKALLHHVVDTRNEFVDALATDPDTLREQIETADSFDMLLEAVETATGEIAPDQSSDYP